MPLVKVLHKVAPKLTTDKAQLFDIEGRRFAIVTVDPEVSAHDMEHAQEVISAFLDMDVLIIGEGIKVEIVEVPALTRHERLASDE